MVVSSRRRRAHDKFTSFSSPAQQVVATISPIHLDSTLSLKAYLRSLWRGDSGTLKYMPSSCFGMTTWYLAITIVCLLGLHPPASACENIEGDLSCLDFNCSLSWEPTGSRRSANEIRYTVYYARRFTAYDVVQEWDAINTCTNISTRYCYLTSLFNANDDFRGNKRFRIDYIHNGSAKCKSKKFQRDPLKSVVLSAPYIVQLEVTPEVFSFRLAYQSVRFQYPGLNLPLLRQFVNHKYHVTIIEASTNTTIKDFQILSSDDYNQMIHDVQPATSYVINVKSVVSPPEVWSPDTTSVSVTTPEKVPSMGPVDLELVNSTFSCMDPDYREVVIRWKAPDMHKWNGKLRFYEIRVVLWNSRDTQLVSMVNTSLTIAILSGLSRWDDYEVMVFANNTAGGARNSIPLRLERHIVDVRGSKPTSIAAIAGQQGGTSITWQAPAQYAECIVEYKVTWTNELGQQRSMTVSGSSLNVAGEVLRVQIIPMIRENYENVKNGIMLIHTSDSVAGSRFNLLFLLLVVAAFFIVVVIILTIAKWKYIKVRWLKSRSRDKFNLNNNKVLRLAFDRHVSYEPCQSHEKEVFDAPSPGTFSANKPPCWSPTSREATYLEHLGNSKDISQMITFHRQGMALVNDFDDINLPNIIREVKLDNVAGGDDSDSPLSFLSDSAIDTQSIGYDRDDKVDIVSAHTLPDNDGYILHSNLPEHLNAIASIADYNAVGFMRAAPVACGVNEQGMSTLMVGNGTEEAEEWHPMGTNDKCILPERDKLDRQQHFSAHIRLDNEGDMPPYVLHSQVISGGSFDMDESIAEYTKQTDTPLGLNKNHKDTHDHMCLTPEMPDIPDGDLITSENPIHIKSQTKFKKIPRVNPTVNTASPTVM